MERSGRWVVGLFCSFLTLGFMSTASGEATYPDPIGGPEAGEVFSQSKFGSPPAPPIYGVRRVSGLMQQEIADSEESGRSLASIKASVQIGDLSEDKGGVAAIQPQSSVSRTGIQEVALIASDLGFFPKTVFVTRDIPVRLFVTGASKKPLCLMLDVFDVRKQVRAERIEEISFLPHAPGQYRFYCPINGMEGTLYVKDLKSASR
jgi:hypothetical protein